jgi:hypothetical protein
MTPLPPVASPGLIALAAAAAAADLTVSSSASWPEADADDKVTPLAGFIESNFSPLLAEVAVRALRGRGQPQACGKVAGYLAARWHLTGPVVCVSGTSAGLDVAALLIADGDADEALVVRVDLAVTEGDADRAAAILVTSPATERPRTHEPEGRQTARGKGNDEHRQH